MKEIKLTQNRIAFVSDEDFEYLNQFNWCVNSGHMVTRGVNKKSILMHRVIMDAPSHLQVDHINGNRLDNRRENLRLATGSQNCTNRKSSTKSTTGFRGVIKHKEKWRARIEINGRKIHLGLFINPKEAAIAYNRAALAWHGEFARLNIIKEVK